MRTTVSIVSAMTTELILQYLTFEDKVRLECVSKQWRKLVFNKQFGIEFFNTRNKNKSSLNGLFRGKVLNKQSLESVLKKRPNISEVNLGTRADSFVLSLIGRYQGSPMDRPLGGYREGGKLRGGLAG